MKITVKIPATHRRPDLQNATLEVDEGKTVQELMNDVQLAEYSIAYVLVNNEKTDITHQLKSGDELFFIPMMAGG